MGEPSTVPLEGPPQTRTSSAKTTAILMGNKFRHFNTSSVYVSCVYKMAAGTKSRNLRRMGTVLLEGDKTCRRWHTKGSQNFGVI